MQNTKTIRFINITFNNLIIFININNKMSIKFIGKAKITKQGQLTLPFEAREELKLDLNSEVYWYLVDDHLIVVKDLVSTEELAAIIKGKKRKKRG